MKDFFISYNKADRQWAEWIAWQLEGASYSATIQAWDFRPGCNFALEMDRAAKESERTILVLSSDFLSSSFTPAEWAAAFVQDPKGENGLVLPIKVRECKLEGLLASLSRIDLVGLTEEEAKKALLEGVPRDRAKPKSQPEFPGQGSVSEQPNFPGALPKGWNVPRRNKNFTGREDLLGRLRSALQSHQPVALHGLGGVGKTQLSIEYAYRYASEYNLVWWIIAETPETLARDFSKLSVLLDLPEKDSRNQMEIVNAVKAWLNKNPKWLLIFDNAKDPGGVGKYIPEGALGDVLITSRNPSWREVAEPISVKELEKAESIDFLCRRTGQEDKIFAAQLAEALGNLPLALEQAGAYIESRNKTFQSYLELFNNYQKDLLSWSPNIAEYAPAVAATWEASFTQAKKEVPESADFLNLLSFFAPEDIPLDVLVERAQDLPEPLSTSLKNVVKSDQIFASLLQYSLIKAAERSISLYRLVQAVVRDRMDEESRKAWAATAIKLVNNAFPFDSDDVRTWKICSYAFAPCPFSG